MSEAQSSCVNKELRPHLKLQSFIEILLKVSFVKQAFLVYIVFYYFICALVKCFVTVVLKSCTLKVYLSRRVLSLLSYSVSQCFMCTGGAP